MDIKDIHEYLINNY